MFAANASGMRYLDGTLPTDHAAATTAGNSVATVPVLLMNADKAAGEGVHEVGCLLGAEQEGVDEDVLDIEGDAVFAGAGQQGLDGLAAARCLDLLLS